MYFRAFTVPTCAPACRRIPRGNSEFDENPNYAPMAFNAGTGGAREMIARGVRANCYPDSIIRFAENPIPEAERSEMQK